MKEIERDHEFEECMKDIENKVVGKARRCESCRIQRFTLAEVNVVRTDKKET